jgi:hypothetical protein
MSKVITSPVKKWPGTVTLSDPLTFPQVFAFEDAISTIQAEQIPTQARADAIWLPVLIACVEEWHLEGLGALSVDNFPATPRQASAQLVAWLIGEIANLFKEAETVPNE